MKLARASFGVLLMAAASAASAQDVIFAFADEEGGIHLSNVPDSGKYKLMVATPENATAEAASGASGRTSPGVTQRVEYGSIIDKVATKYGIDSALLHAVITVESGYNPAAVSKRGAAGLMQLMPETAKRYGVKDVFNPMQNVEGGARYLIDLLKIFNNDINLTLAAYNAGENSVIRNGNQIPPYRETKAYIPRVVDFYKKYQSPM